VPTPERKRPAERREESAIGRPDDGPGLLPAKHQQLMAQNQQLGILGELAAATTHECGRRRRHRQRDTDGDWLTVNVWLSDLGAARMPVMAWIHGEGYVYGWSGDLLFDGAALARRGAVVVTNLPTARKITPTRVAKGVIGDAAGTGFRAQEACC
jgi:hypothetical protein